MKRKPGRLHVRQLISLILVLAFTVSCLSFETFAETGDPVPAYRYQDGTQAVIDSLEDAGGELAEPANGEYVAPQEISLPATPLTTRLLEVYSTYFFFNGLYAGSMATLNGMYLSCSPDGGKTWSSPVKVNYWEQKTFTGLTADKDYLVRIQTPSGAVVGTYKIHTGKPTTPVKSVSAKAVNVRKHRVRNRTPYLGLPLSGYHYEYTYKIKITVNMKKKPGTPGIFVNGIWMKGNKKKYTKTLSGTYRSLTNPHRLKFTVTVYSAVDASNSYGGYSPLWQKTKRL